MTKIRIGPLALRLLMLATALEVKHHFGGPLLEPCSFPSLFQPLAVVDSALSVAEFIMAFRGEIKLLLETLNPKRV